MDKWITSKRLQIILEKRNQDNMLIRKMTEILYHQYIKELKEGRIHTNKDITKIKERVK